MRASRLSRQISQNRSGQSAGSWGFSSSFRTTRTPPKLSRTHAYRRGPGIGSARVPPGWAHTCTVNSSTNSRAKSMRYWWPACGGMNLPITSPLAIHDLRPHDPAPLDHAHDGQNQKNHVEPGGHIELLLGKQVKHRDEIDGEPQDPVLEYFPGQQVLAHDAHGRDRGVPVGECGVSVARHQGAEGDGQT